MEKVIMFIVFVTGFITGGFVAILGMLNHITNYKKQIINEIILPLSQVINKNCFCRKSRSIRNTVRCYSNKFVSEG